MVEDTVNRYSHGRIPEDLSDDLFGNGISRISNFREDFSMEQMLQKRDLQWAPLPYVIISTAAYRIIKGFPSEDRLGLSFHDDAGDLLQGHIVLGEGYEAIASTSQGVTFITPGCEQKTDLSVAAGLLHSPESI